MSGLFHGESSGAPTRLLVVSSLILAAALTRLLPHPPNFTPITAVALFGGTLLPLRWAFLITFGAMALSDIALGILLGNWSVTFHSTLPAVYGSFALTILLAAWLLRPRCTLGRLAGVTFTASLLFFVVTNFAVWLSGELYPKTWGGLIACYVAALPFFRNSFAGDVLFTAVLFGIATVLGYVPLFRFRTVGRS